MAVDFGSLASCYAALEQTVFGRALERARSAHLGRIAASDPNRILLTGEGDGRFLQALVQRTPGAEITCVDSSNRMLARARSRLGSPAPPSVRFVHADILTPHSNRETPKYDTVASHFFLDCFNESEIAAIAERITRRLVPGGLWIITDFQNPDPGDPWPRRIYRATLLRAMYLFFRTTANLRTGHLPNFHPIVIAAGLTPIAQEDFLNGFVNSTAYQTP